MGRRVAHRRIGRTRLLTQDVEDILVAAVRAGAPMRDAAANAGISVRAFEVWRARGRDELEAREDGEPPDPSEEVFVELFRKTETAQAQARVRGVMNIRRVAQGGIVTEESTRRWRDPDTGDLIEETTIKRTAPDWRADAFLLERLHRTAFGKQQEVSLTGPDGGPLQVQHAVDLTSAAARIHESLALSAGPSMIPGDLVPEAKELTGRS